jgi:hypothetical protein
MKILDMSSTDYRAALETQKRREKLNEELKQLERRLTGMFEGAVTPSRRATGEGVRNGTRKPRKTNRQFGRGELSEKAVNLIKEAGSEGISGKDLATKLHCDVTKNIWPWYYGTGRKMGMKRNKKTGNLIAKTS